MKTKIAIITIGFFLIQFIFSCCKDVQYYDFTEMSVVLSDTSIKIEDNLSIELLANDVEYLSNNFSSLGYTTAFATSCDKGWGGMKYPFEKIEIISDVNFSSKLPAKEDLTSLFQIKIFSRNGGFNFVPVEEIDFKERQTTNIEFLLKERPEMEDTHSFTIKLVKSNEEEIIIKTEEIIWQ